MPNITLGMSAKSDFYIIFGSISTRMSKTEPNSAGVRLIREKNEKAKAA